MRCGISAIIEKAIIGNSTAGIFQVKFTLFASVWMQFVKI